MSTLILRSFADSMGWKWPANVASVVDGRKVTWDEIMERRRKMQRRRLEFIRSFSPRIVPCYVWTFEVPGSIFGGWWCYVMTIRDEIAVNFRGFDEELAINLMSEINLGFLPIPEMFHEWMQALAEVHPRVGVSDPRKAGSFVGWFDRERRRFALNKSKLEKKIEGE